MLSDLLEQDGIKSNIEGEYLQGGIGELQAHGFVRIAVDDADYDAARALVKAWESSQPAIEAPATVKPKGSKGGLGFIVGLLVGVSATYWVYSSPVSKSGIDYDRNGVNDVVWIFKDNRLTKAETDRNFDGNVDFIVNYSIKGLISSSQLDDDFDGVFETTAEYWKGVPYIQELDSNKDGITDDKSYLEYGVLNKVEIYGDSPGVPVKVQHFSLGKLVSAEFDSDGNGTLDVLYEYDRFEEVVKKTNIHP